MAKTKQQKQAIVAAYKTKLSNATGVILVSPTGLKPSEVNAFKKKLSGAGASFNVITNTLFKIALKENDLPELPTLELGEHAAVFAGSDVAQAAKLLKDFMNEHKDNIVVKAGILEGQVLSESQVKALADMPSKEQSIAMIAGILTQPLTGVVNVLEDSVRSVAIIITQAFKE